MASEVPESSRTPEERWAAIQRTQRKMAPPPGGEDVGALLARSMDAYWAAKEQAAAAEIGDVPKAFERAAAWLRKESFQKEFWSDFGFAFIPVALVLLVDVEMGRADFAFSGWLPWVATGVALLVFALAWRRRSIPALRYSIGALAAGLLVSVGVGLYLYRQSDVSTNTTLALLRWTVEDALVSSLSRRLEDGKEWTPEFKAGGVSIQSYASGDGMVYKAFAHRFPGALVAHLGRTSAEVRWEAPHQEGSVQTYLAAGRLVSADARGDWQLAAPSRNAVLDLWADPGRVGLQPKPGECLIVVYEPGQPRNKVERAVRLDSCRALEKPENAPDTAGQPEAAVGEEGLQGGP